MKLALVISSLGGGGAERVMTVLANAWASRGDDVTLITLSAAYTDVYCVSPGVKRIGLDLLAPSWHIWQAVYNNWRRAHALRKVIVATDPDVIVSFMTNTNILTVFSCLGMRVPVIVSERISIADYPPQGMWKRLFRFAYRRCSAVVAQTERNAASLREITGRNITRIPNPLSAPSEDGTEEVVDLLERLPFSRRLLAVGRLRHQKGFDLLLEAFARATADHADWGLLILGEGPERGSLAEKAIQLDLVDRVVMPGFVGNPQAVMRRADAFVLSSRFEGMPNALLEAMACGMPCVSFACPTGPEELIINEVNGLLVAPEDIGALANALERIMASAPLRARLGQAAVSIHTQFDIATVLGEWDKLFSGVWSRRASWQEART